MQRIAPIASVLTLVAGVAVAQPEAAAQPETDTPPRLEVVDRAAITVGEKIVFRSEILSDDVTMSVYVPESFAISSDDHTYPVIFANGGHGREFFPTLAGIVKLLGSRERMPESIVVSLNNGGAIPEVFTNGMWSRETIGGSTDPRKSLRHLEEEVIPYLEKHYRANDYRMIIGVSGSSLFPIYTFTEAPELFDSHVLIAAADMLGMGYEAGKTFVDAFEAALEKTPQREAKLYVGVAGDDLEQREDYRPNLEELSRRLRRFEALDLKVEVVRNTDHYEVFIKAVQSALDQNFPKQRWSSRYRELVAQPGDALENIDRYYAELSQVYGFKILPRADRWNSVNCLRFMTRHLIQQERMDEALAIAERRVEYHPRVPGSFTGLADALEAKGDLRAAVKAQEKALALAKAGGGDTVRLEARLQLLREKEQGLGDDDSQPDVDDQ